MSKHVEGASEEGAKVRTDFPFSRKRLLSVMAMTAGFGFVGGGWMKQTRPEAAGTKAAEDTHRMEEAMLEASQREMGGQLPLIYGWSLAEVEKHHGAASDAGQGTGWVVWPTFRAHFANGIVDEVKGSHVQERAGNESRQKGENRNP